MSHSKRKSLVMATTNATSEKKDKQLANRANRRINKRILQDTLDDTQQKHRRILSDIWTWAKDGKAWVRQLDPKWLRK